MDDLTHIFGDVISSYTRAQAIEDGYLIDLGTFSFRPNLTVLQEVGIKFPVSMTRAAYSRAVQEDGRDLPPSQDLSGRTFEVVYMLKQAIKRSAGGSEIRYSLSVINWRTATGQSVKRQAVQLKALCGPGDDGEPVITIMLPDED
jgi:hypothetical protein